MSSMVIRGYPKRKLERREISLQKISDIQPVKGGESEEIIAYDITSKDEMRHLPETVERIESVHQNPQYLELIDGEPVRTFSDKYTPVQDVNIHEALSETIKESGFPILGDTSYKMGEYGTLGILTLEERVPIIKAKPGELYNYTICWQNSIDGSRSLAVRGSWLRIICSNGLIATHSEVEGRIVHLNKARDEIWLLAEAVLILKKILNYRGKEIDFYNDMFHKKIDSQRMKWVLNKLSFNKKECQLLAKHGVYVQWEEGEVSGIDVGHVSQFFREVVVESTTEWGFFNAISNVSRSVRDIDRQMELLNRCLALIVKSRYVSGDAEAGIF
jgi:hypothetical protein